MQAPNRTGKNIYYFFWLSLEYVWILLSPIVLPTSSSSSWARNLGNDSQVDSAHHQQSDLDPDFAPSFYDVTTSTFFNWNLDPDFVYFVYLPPWPSLDPDLRLRLCFVATCMYTFLFLWLLIHESNLVLCWTSKLASSSCSTARFDFFFKKMLCYLSIFLYPLDLCFNILKSVTPHLDVDIGARTLELILVHLNCIVCCWSFYWWVETCLSPVHFDMSEFVSPCTFLKYRVHNIFIIAKRNDKKCKKAKPVN